MATKRELVIEHERQAWALRQQGWTHERIAAELHLERSTVTKILARLSARYAKALAGDVDAVKGQQLAQLEHIVDESLEAWRRSIGPVTVTTVKQTTVLVPDAEAGAQIGLPGEEVTTRTEIKAGAAEYLGKAMEALGAMRKIMGLDAPTKLSDPHGDPLDLVKVYIGVDLDQI